MAANVIFMALGIIRIEQTLYIAGSSIMDPPHYQTINQLENIQMKV